MSSGKIKHAEATCPHCSTNFIAGVDVSDIVNTMQPKEIVREVAKLPSFIPGYSCVNGNCDRGNWHPSEWYSQKPNKRCANCETLNGTNSKRCYMCKGSEFYDDLLSDEELEELGIPLPAAAAQDERMAHHHSHEH